MDANNKSTKPKQAQYNMLTSLLAQFDIQTQVNKIVMRQFDSLMRTNKQAFDYIKQSEHKFIEFEQRLSKAQIYYKNIESSIESKIVLTQNVNSRLEQFSTQFWTSMKENNNEVTTMIKRLDHVLMERRQLESRVGVCEKELVKSDSAIQSLRDKVNVEIQQLVDMIRENENRTQRRFIKESTQIRQIAQNIIESTSLMQSKSTLLSKLLNDLELYKNDRPQIKLQLDTLYSDLQNRALKQDVIEVRGYVDSKVVQERQQVNKLWMRVDTQIKVSERDRKKDMEKMFAVIRQTETQLQKDVNKVSEFTKNQISSFASHITNSQSQTNQTLNQLTLQQFTFKQAYTKQVPQLYTKCAQLLKFSTDLTAKTQDIQNQITQLFSNNESTNQLIDMIMKQSQKRKQELMSLKSRSSNDNGGNVEEQLVVVFEKVYQLEKQLGIVKTQDIQQLNNYIEEINSKYNETISVINIKVGQLQKYIQQNSQSITKSITQTQNNLTNQLKKYNTNLQTKIALLSQSTKQQIESKLTSIQQKLTSLDAIHDEVKQFKEQFKRQLEINEKVNQSIGEKMERMMASLSKMKSDTTVRIEQVSMQLQRRAGDIKNTVAELQEIKKHLSLVNETIYLLLTTNIFSSASTSKDSIIAVNSTLLNNSAQSKLQPTSSLSKPIKITSMLQGWILESDQLQEKVKYRGENFSLSNRIKFLLSFLQYFVKVTEKIKGTILQNGRDIFMKIIESNGDIFTQRRRPTSKRKASQLLPKLYL